MSKKENSHPETNQDKAKKPSDTFNNFKVFNSIEEMERDELKWLAGLSPEEHVHHAVSLIKRVYYQQLEKHPKIGTHIHFD